MKTLFFNHSKKKAFAKMESRMDPDVEMIIPTLRIATKMSSKDDVIDFHGISDPIDQAYVLFSAIKRIVGVSKKKHSLTATLIPCTPFTRKLCGFETENFKEAVKYSVRIPEDQKRCNGTWDCVLGKNWDMIPCHESEGGDVLIKTMRFSENREFGMFTIRIQLVTCQGHYKSSNYRALCQNSPSAPTLHT